VVVKPNNDDIGKEIEKNRIADNMSKNLDYLADLSKNLTSIAKDNIKKFDHYQENGGSELANNEINIPELPEKEFKSDMTASRPMTQ